MKPLGLNTTFTKKEDEITWTWKKGSKKSFQRLLEQFNLSRWTGALSKTGAARDRAVQVEIYLAEPGNWHLYPERLLPHLDNPLKKLIWI